MDTATDARPVNNAIYALGDRWYSADDDPVALLRAESRLRNPWVAARVVTSVGARARVLDIGCGAGFLAKQTRSRARGTKSPASTLRRRAWS